jgi:hypothetical protein
MSEDAIKKFLEDTQKYFIKNKFCYAYLGRVFALAITGLAIYHYENDL